MSKTLLGMVTFGNLMFSKLTIESILNTTTKPLDLFVVVGKPGDKETIDWLEKNGIPHVVHPENYGFPYGLNDIYDRGWKDNSYDNIIIAGNDIIAYPNAIDSLIEVADTTKYEWVSACQYDVKALIRDFPECGQFFKGSRCEIDDDGLESECWNKFKGYDSPIKVSQPGLSDIHNLALYKRSVYEKVGYIDVNFYPAYFSDNDYARRGVNVGMAEVAGTLVSAVYFHFWSRTIHQGNNILIDKHHSYFRANAQFYMIKWGGEFGRESYNIPFGGKHFMLSQGITLDPVLNIQSREQEKNIVAYWRELAT
uniref:Putative methyltransferase n=1 Tax=viral metagenome TaxID=1070528 RepID=A0A6M3IVR9_9ZZZZ